MITVIWEDDAAGTGRFLPEGALWALGCFDGLHLGHTALLRDAKREAEALGLPLGVWSPRGAKNAPVLLGAEEKREALERLGAAYYLEEDFSRIRDLSARAFFFDRLIARFGARALACGENFTFGKGREGDVGTLRRLCAEAGVFLSVTKTVYIDGEAVSSAAVRRALADGLPGKAEKLLGRAYGFRSEIARGRRVGRTIGFPTVNLPFPEGTDGDVLRKGVYAAGVTLEDGVFRRAAANVGVRPTFEKDGATLCEAYLLDPPDGEELYGQSARIEFLHFLRPERAFEDARALARQMRRDAAACKEFFSARRTGGQPIEEGSPRKDD